MTRKIRGAALVALGASLALVAAGCSAGNGDSGDSGGGNVTLTVWHNASTGPGKAYWKKSAKEFEAAHKNVTIKLQAIQNESFDGKLQTALNSGNPPDVFLQRGGGKMDAMIQAGQLLDITDSITPETKQAIGEAAIDANKVDGKVYAMPTTVSPEGIFYSKDLFKKAGITQVPTTMDELNTAVSKLKSAGITPVAVGAKNAWPAAHWYYNFAMRECSKATLDKTAKSLDFSAGCWEQAGKDLKKFADSKPFQPGFLTTEAQQGAGSSAGLLANHKAAMELMGAWDPGVISSLTPDKKPLPDLSWFPFPAISGGEGDPGAIMGAGSGGLSCSSQAPKKICAEFLNFQVTKKQQTAYYKAFDTPPLNKAAQSAITEPYMKSIVEAYNKAPYLVTYLDTLYGQNVGNALNVGVVNLLAGKGDVADIIKTVNKAAAKG